MKAAVLYAYGEAPRYETFQDPVAQEGEVIVQVKTAALTNISKMKANGEHYERYDTLPAVVGVDGVGVLEDGTRVFCGGCREPFGMMAERTVVARHWCLPIPDRVDDLTAAAIANPAMSSWLALEYRAQLQPGENVLILGATGTSGKLAIQIAKHLGAGRIIAVGRNEQTLQQLSELGADSMISLNLSDEELRARFAEEAQTHGIHVVLDYLWSHPAEVLLDALTGHDLKAKARRTRYLSIGEMAGATINLPSAALRSSGVELFGSGGGSIDPMAIIQTFPKMWELAAQGLLRLDIEAVPLSDVEQVWTRARSDRRLVLIP